MTKNTRTFWIIVAIVIIIILAIIFATRKTPEGIKNLAMIKINGTVLSKPKNIKSFRLISNSGKKFTDDKLKDHWTLLYFGFTRCQTICPKVLKTLNEFYQGVQDQMPKNLLPQVVMVSIDPERDKVKDMNKYVKSFNSNFIGLTGDMKQVQDLAKQMNVTFKKVKKEKGDYTTTHSASIMLISPEKKLLAYFSYPQNSTQMIKDYEKIVQTYDALHHLTQS